MNQETLWREINDLEDAMNDEESHYGKTPAWHTMKTEHSKLWKQATAEDAPAQPERRTVEIPYLAGDFYTTRLVELDWICPVCGDKRGEVYRTLSYDGSLRVNCDGWQNPCGHVDKYPDVLKEAQAAFEAQQQAEAAPDTPASVDSFLFGKDVDVKRLQAHELHEADGAPVEDKDVRIRQLESELANEKHIRQTYGKTLEEIEHHTADFFQDDVLQSVLCMRGEHSGMQDTIKKLKALLSEAAQVLAPLENIQDDYIFRHSDDSCHIALQSNDEEFHAICNGNLNYEWVQVKHLRAIAEFAAKLKGVTNDAT
jgi:hypothetical protein